MIYKWDGLASLNPALCKLDPNKVGKRVEEIQEANGDSFNVKHIVEDARDLKSLLNSAFEWDEAKAAEEYRLGQARHLLGSLAVVTVGEGGTPVIYRAFISVQEDKRRKQLLKTAMKEIEAWQKRYKMYEDLKTITAAITQVKTDLDQKAE